MFISVVLPGKTCGDVLQQLQILEDIHKLIIKSQDTNLFLAALPMRHDMPGVNYKILAMNAALEK